MIEILSNLFKKYFYSPLGLVLGNVLISISIILPFDSFLEKGIPSFSTRLFIYAVINMLWILFWICLRNYYPKKKEDKIGMIICVGTENDKQTLRIRKDFVEGINNLLKQNNLYGLFHIIVLQDYKAIRTSDILREYIEKKSELIRKKMFKELRKYAEYKRFDKINKKINGHFYIWGTIKERKDIENKYILNLDALVTHRPIKLDISERFSQEFQKFFPREISFFEKIEVDGFKMTSNYIVLAARYITGVAALLSGDPFIAYKLHNGLEEEINKYRPIPPPLIQVLEGLKEYLFLELILKGKHYNYVENDLEKSKEYYDKAGKIKSNDYAILVFGSIYSFLAEKNLQKSLEYLKRASKISTNDYTWLYNRAFLHMYDEKFDLALKDYKKLAKLSFQGEDKIITECIRFNEKLLKNEPEKKQSLFILGFLYYFKEKNLPMALEKFEKYMKDACADSKYNYLCTRAVTYIIEIKKKMGLEND